MLFVASTVLLVAGSLAWLVDADVVASTVWGIATLAGLAYSSATLFEAVRHRQPSVDVIAWLALVGALLVREPFAGAVIAVMLGSGVLLEARAAARARRELSLLVSRAPRVARRHTPGVGVVEVPVAEVVPGDRLLVGSGEIVAVDGRLLGPGVFDESALTGESRPVSRRAGEDVHSGILNTGAPVDMVATATAASSTYAGVVRLVEQAQASSAPFVRVADRFALAFVPVTLALAGLAWLLSADPVRAVAVLVVATPCPLLLAAPIAFMSGLSRAARAGVVIKGGSALERLASGRVLLFDKTGTLTRGRPTLTDVITAEGIEPDTILGFAASLDQASPHPLAGAIVGAARDRELVLSMPEEVCEQHGYGVSGRVDGRLVRLGTAAWAMGQPLPAWVRQARRRAELDGSLAVFASVDGTPAAVLLFEDPIRPDAPRMMRALRATGIRRVVLVTGDRPDIAETVGRLVGVDAVYAERDPGEKLAIVREESDAIMVGDGINDAPALAAAKVGVALAARGATAAAEAADVVLTVDRIDALADAILISRRAHRIALLAVFVGMGLSVLAMLAAAAGALPPAVGAVLQEVIDVAAIGIALIALVPVRTHTVVMTPADLAAAQHLYEEHRAMRPLVERIRGVADGLSIQDDLGAVRRLAEALDSELLPHERAEEADLLPIMERTLGGVDPTGAFSRTHAEIEHQVARLRRLLDDLDAGAEPEDVIELRRLLYGLYAILRLHNAQEEEGAFSLLREEPAVVAST
jgi:heavy metal translocating P-type ATPase